jgi:hypothetical protein
LFSPVDSGGGRKGYGASADDGVLRFELKNTKPVDLLDLTSALTAFAEAYQDHVIGAGYDLDRDNVRLFVREIRTGSIIADPARQIYEGRR